MQGQLEAAWLDDVYQLIEEGRNRASMDVILDKLDDMMDSDDLDGVVACLRVVEVSRLNKVTALAFVFMCKHPSVVQAMKSELPESDFLEVSTKIDQLVSISVSETIETS